MSVANSNSTPIAPASIMGDDQSAAITTLGPLDQPPQTPLIPSKRDYDTESNDPTRRSKRTKPDGSPTTGDTLSVLPFAQHNNRIYHPGDHAIFDDFENTTGTHGTPFAAVGQIHQLEQQPASGAVLATVNWYVHPQFTSHPPTMEFYRMAVLRTFRQTVVPLERIRSACFVVPPADLMVGRPGEWREGDALFVCESRYVDKGEFIQKVKQWGKGFWPEGMSEERKAMLMTMVPWPAGPRVLERAVIPSDNVLGANPDEPSGEDAGRTPQQNRRVTRMSATPQQSQSQSQSQMTMQTPTSVPRQAQIPGFPPMMPQGRMPMGITNGQPQPPPPQYVLNQFQQQQHQLQMQIQMQRQMTANPPYMQTPMSPNTNTNAPVTSSAATPSVPVTPLPRRRGRPPKNKQLIEKRAMEDAAAAAAGLGRTPPKPPTVSTRRQASMVAPYQNNGRPPLSQIQQQQQFQQQQQQRLNGFVGVGNSVNGGQRAMPMMQGNMNQTQAYAIRNPNGNNTGQTPLQQHQQQQLRQQQQQQQVKKIAPLPYIDPTSVPQLSKEI
ncbi:hypothetical protein GGF37_000984, partial [Kickxella alabastrina]